MINPLIRSATSAEVSTLNELIAASARALGSGFYSEAQTEAAIAHVFGVDSELVADGTYLVVEDAGGAVIGCGGWSRYKTLFGGDHFVDRDSGLLDPKTEPAKIRAFFVSPNAARAGIGSLLLAECEGRAAMAGFGSTALMATLPGVPFYRAKGYRAEPEHPAPLRQYPCSVRAHDKTIVVAEMRQSSVL